MRGRLILATTILALGCDFAAAGQTIELVLLGGTPAPSTGGRNYLSLGYPDVNDAGEVAFFSTLSGSTISAGIFRHSGASGALVALRGQPAPASGGGTYLDLASGPEIDGSGRVYFSSTISGGSTTQGLFENDHGTNSAIALLGGSAPGTGGGTYSSLGPPCVSDGGDFAFPALVSGGSGGAGVFVDSGGVLTAIVVAGQAAPGGGDFSNFGTACVNDSGDVAFFASVTGGTGSTGIFFRAPTGGLRAVARTASSAPGTGGGTFYSFLGGAPQLAINNRGDVAFSAGITGGSAVEGVFIEEAQVLRAATLTGDPLPENPSKTFQQFYSGPALSDSGTLTYSATTNGSIPNGIYRDSGGVDSRVVLDLETAPGTGGGVYLGLPDFVSGSKSGNVAFWTGISGGTGHNGSGIFLVRLAPEPGTGSLGVTAIAAIATVYGAMRRHGLGTRCKRLSGVERRRAQRAGGQA